jgi:hypothetical protein
MTRYEPKRADAIAAALFKELTSPFRKHPHLLSRICGISSGTLWLWRIGRWRFNVDVLSEHCDRFARALGLPLELAEEAANLMSGIPWKGRKTGSQLLHYVVDQGLDARLLVHLARRQKRLGITQFFRKMGVPRSLLYKMLSSSDYEAKHPGMRLRNAQVTLLAKRLGITLPDEITIFRVLAMRGSAIPRASQRELKEAFRRRSGQPRHLFLIRFLTLLKERHGLPNRGALTDVVWEQTFPSDAKASASMSIGAFKRRLHNNLRPAPIGCSRLPEDWAKALAEFAFPDEREATLRQVLARYLENRDARQGKLTKN